MNRAKRQRSRNALIVLAAVGILAVVFSCTPDSGVTPEESDVVVTYYDKDVDFSAIDYYSMPDSIVHITGDTTKTDSDLLDRRWDGLILDTIANHLNDLGYTRVYTAQPDTAPDVMVLVSASARKNYDAYTSYSWYDYWGWYAPWDFYWGGWGPGWGYGYGWSTTTVYSYTTGTLIVNMVDPDERDVSDELVPVEWSGVLNGVLSESSVSTGDRLIRGIDQMFKQSPYLGKN